MEDDTAMNDLIFPWAEKPIKQFKDAISATVYHYYITGEIEGDVDKYIDMIHTIKGAEAHDRIIMYINTPGGAVHTTIQILAAMQQSDAEITTVLEGEACSAGSLIFLAGDVCVVNDHCVFMIHNQTYGSMGKGAEVAKQVEFESKYFKELAMDLYHGFLTEEEIVNVCNDHDIWLTSTEVRNRLMCKIQLQMDADEEAEKPKVKKPKVRAKKKPAASKEVAKPKAKVKAKAKVKT